MSLRCEPTVEQEDEIVKNAVEDLFLSSVENNFEDPLFFWCGLWNNPRHINFQESIVKVSPFNSVATCLKPLPRRERTLDPSGLAIAESGARANTKSLLPPCTTRLCIIGNTPKSTKILLLSRHCSSSTRTPPQKNERPSLQRQFKKKETVRLPRW